MKLFNFDDHLNCLNYDHSDRSQIEYVKCTKDDLLELSATSNEVVLFLKGSVSVSIFNSAKIRSCNGKMLFLPIGSRCTYQSDNDATFMIFRLYSPVRLCESYLIEHLYGFGEGDIFGESVDFKLLYINPRIRSFANDLAACITDGIHCRHYFEMKIKEFFITLHHYYSKEDIRDFLYPILSPDSAFSEYVKSNRNKYPTVIALAESMRLTQKQFSKRFKDVFGKTPYSWMKEGRAQTIYYEIASTKKPFKQIAFENGFGSISQFTKFCKKELNRTPQELRN